ncbi:FAD-dependent monooxygenase, partial [Ameyamaea chiangmaiensis]
MTRDVVIAGAGPVGLALALSLDDAGFGVTLVDPTPEHALANPAFDGREIALTHHAVAQLRAFGAWDDIPDVGKSPLREARVETGRDGARQPLIFDLPDDTPDGVEALGTLVSNHMIRKAL